MTDEQLVREIRRIHYCPSMTDVAARAGLHRVTLYRIVKSGQVQAKYRDALVRAIRYATNEVYDNPRSAPH